MALPMMKNARKGVKKQGTQGVKTNSPVVKGLTPLKGKKAHSIPMPRIDPVVGSHGFGHSKSQCEGPLRMSGVKGAYRAGKR